MRRGFLLVAFFGIGAVAAAFWSSSSLTQPELADAGGAESPDSALVDVQADDHAEGLFSDEAEAEAGPVRPVIGPRIYPVGTIDIEAIQQARLARHANQQAAQRSGGIVPAWLQRGPNNIQGRVTDLAVDPRDDDVCYIGAAEGGVFRTIDGGSTWVPVFDDQPSMSMGAVALDPLNPDIVYAGTGEPNTSADSYPGTGIYKSLDQGTTWNHIGLDDSATIARIVIHPTNTDIIHVAVMGNVWSATNDRGVYRSTDGGLTWTNVLFVNDITGCADIVQRPDNPDVLFAAMWERYRNPQERITGGLGCGVYKSIDGGLTWALQANGLPAPSVDNGRIGLAMCASNPDVMCTIHTQTAGPFDALYRTTDGGDTWVQTNDGDLSNMYSSFGWYFGNVRIDPLDEDIIYALGQRFYRSTDGGDTWDNIGGMHVDHHAFGFGVAAGSKRYCGNDGGVYTSTDGVNWTKTSGDLPITQAYRMATAEWNTDAVWLGTQDNGTLQDLNGDGNFNGIFGGDGFAVLPHLTNSDLIWAQYQWGNVFFYDGNDWLDARDGLSGRRGWDAPHIQDPTDPQTRYFGTDSVHRNNGDTSWTTISPDLTNGPGQGSLGVLSAIEVSPVDPDIIWAGSNDGLVHITTDGGGNWTDVSAGLPDRWITSLRPHPAIAGEALVSVSGFRWGEDVSHVYRTTDFGQNRSAIYTALHDIPVGDIYYDPDNTKRYFAATDIGVYFSPDEGQSWSAYGVGMPPVAVVDFAKLDATRELFAGTHGRSIFSIVIPEHYSDSLNIAAGQLRSGTIEELKNSDNEDVSMDRGNSISSVTTMELKTTTAVELPSQLNFVIEASVFARGNVTQTVSLYNYDSDQFEEVDSRLARRFIDQTIQVAPVGDLSRFVEPGTGCMEARIRFQGATQRMQFTANVDRAYWEVAE
ncbi:MAG: hypothetical protein AAF456_08385 [Planctomycetota bacterium]